MIETIPEALNAFKSFNQWIIWTTVERDGKLIKLPVNYLTAEVTDAHNSEAWTDAETAINARRLFGDKYGIGFVFTKDDPFYFVDIDNCANPLGGWNDNANVVMSYFPDAAVEVSQSGKGLHIFGMYTTMPDHSCKNIPLGLEFYNEARFVALTGTNIIGSAGTNGDQYLPAFINNYMAPRIVETPETWTTTPVEGCNPLDDEALIKKALGSKSAAGAFGVRATFRNLWEREVEALSAVYVPDASDKGEFDESSADMALVSHLTFWTGKNCEHIERLMWQSGLVRDKWKKHKSYLRNTIIRAVSLQADSNVYGQSVQTTNSTDSIDNVEMRTGFQFLAATQQVKHFVDCVYVRDLNRVYTPDGSLLNREQFNATYGGYVFELDSGGSGKTTRKAWEAFTESLAINYPWAHGVCFRPELLK